MHASINRGLRRFFHADAHPRLLSAALALLAFLALACGGAEPSAGSADSDAAPGEERVLRISQGSDTRSMDPYFALESPTFGVLCNIFEGLTDIDENMNLVPELAESWRNIDDHTWEFKLREGVTFHDGQPFTAEDVRYSLRRAIDWPQSRLRSEIPSVDEIEVVDPHTVRIRTRVPDAILPTRLASVFLLDKESSEAGLARDPDSLSTNANGTGPYKLERWVRDDHCLLTANENYRNGAPEVKKLSFLATSNEATRMAALLNGQVDILVNVPVNDVDRIDALPGYHLVKQPSLRLIYLGLDVGRDETPGIPSSPPNPLKNLRVRQAIYRAINEDLIVEKVMNGLAEPAAQLMPPPVTGHDPSIERPAYDPAEAKRLLAEAGFPDGFMVHLDGPNDRYVNDESIMTAIAGQLARVGIEVNVRAAPKARFFPLEEQAETSFFLIGWANTNGDGNGTFDHLLHTPDTEKNVGGANTSTHYSNPEVDRLAEAAWSEFDPDKREALLQEASRIVMNDLPHIPLHYQMDLYAVSDRVEWSPRRDTQVRGNKVRWNDSE